MSSQRESSRREFLASSAKVSAVAGAMSMGAAARAQGQAPQAVHGPKPPAIKPDQVIRLGFVGVGGRGGRLVDESLKQDKIAVVAIADPCRENARQASEKVAARFGRAPELYAGEEDYKKLLARDDVDAVFVAVPCDIHGRMYLDAFAAGKHFYGEKPLCIRADEADALVAAQKKNPDLICQIGFQRRATEFYQVGVRRIHEGMIGAPFEARATWRISWEPLGLPDQGTKVWFGRRQRSGDWMLEQACHSWDVLCWVAGDVPRAAAGTGRDDLFKHLDPQRDVTDFYVAHLEFSNGMVATFEHNWCCPHKDNDRFGGVYERFAGPQGGVSLALSPPDCTFCPRDPNGKITKLAATSTDTTWQSVDAFFRTLRSGGKPVSGVENGRMATLTGLLVRKAVYEKRRVEMKEIIAS